MQELYNELDHLATKFEVRIVHRKQNKFHESAAEIAMHLGRYK